MALKLPPYPVEYLEINFINEPDKTDVENYVKLQNQQILPFGVSGVINSSLISAKFLTHPDDDDVKKVIEICVNIEDIQYQPGYTFGILPQNNIDEVNKLISRLEYTEDSNKIFNVSAKQTNAKRKNKIPIHVPVIGTIRQVLLNNLDIRSIPKKLFLRALHKYTTNDTDKNLLDELCSQQSSEKYSNFISEFIPLLELFNKIPSCFPPFTILLEHLPRLTPRPYSATSSPNFHQSHVKFAFNLVKLPKNYEGVCSGWLHNAVGEFLTNPPVVSNFKIPLYLRKPNKFVIPENETKNLILIATGTGIAPFISFLQHYSLIETEKPKILLFYGCRYSNKDFLYKNEIEQFLQTGVITKLFTSFSRETSGIKYVQDNIRENSQEFLEFYDNNAILYVCGGKKMSCDVFDTIVNCIHAINDCSIENARDFVTDLKNTNKYIEDIWD